MIEITENNIFNMIMTIEKMKKKKSLRKRRRKRGRKDVFKIFNTLEISNIMYISIVEY